MHSYNMPVVSHKLYAQYLNAVNITRFVLYSSTSYLRIQLPYVISLGVSYRYRPMEGLLMQLPPVQFLLLCSDSSLGEFELNRLNKAANLAKAIAQMQYQLREVEGEALLARWLMEYRDVLLSSPKQVQPVQTAFDFSQYPALSPARPAKARHSKPIKEICA